MKSEKRILVAFILNLFFSIIEFFGALFTGSVAILSDSLHDMGDAFSIGASYFLERKSKRRPDGVYTYGYLRYSVLGGVTQALLLFIGSVLVISHSVERLLDPTPLHYDGMIILAAFGVLVNLAAAFFTREGGSLNQRSVNLHMLEDLLGWIVVLVGAIVMRVSGLSILDPLLSIGVALFIVISASKTLWEAFCLFLEKAPRGMDVQAIGAHVGGVEGVVGVHHIHVWSLDGECHCATMHIVTNEDPKAVKERVKRKLKEQGIAHATLELETVGEGGCEKDCRIEAGIMGGHPHHQHHRHHH